MPENIFIQITEFLKSQRWVGKKREIFRETRLVEDLGIDGDDGSKLIEDFSATFNVDCTEFEFDKYFNSEGYNLFGFLLPKSWRPVESKYPNKLPIFVSDLERSIEKGKWTP